MLPTELAGIIVAQALQASRTLQSTKGFWGYIPTKWQFVPPTLLMLVTEVAAKLETGVKSWVDLIVPVALVLGTMLPGMRSNVHAALHGLAMKAVADPMNPLESSDVALVTRSKAKLTSIATSMFIVLALVGCSSVPQLNTTKPAPSAKPVEPRLCTTEYATEMAAACYLRVRTECVDKGVPKESCQALKDCDAAADARLEECRR